MVTTNARRANPGANAASQAAYRRHPEKVLIASPGQAVSVSTGRVASSPVTPGKGWVTAAPAGLMAGAVMVAGRARVRSVSAVAVDHCEIAPSLDASC